MSEAYSPGLEGIIAGETTISTIVEGEARLTYRGYDIHELASKSTFEEVVYLLLYGELPSQHELDIFCGSLKADREIPGDLIKALQVLPKGKHPMDYLRTAISFLSAYDPDVADQSREANFRKAMRIIAKTATIVAAIQRIHDEEEVIKPDPNLSHAANFLYMLHGSVPDEETARLFDTSLICYGEHGFNASAFCSRVTVSTRSDIYSGIVAGIGTLKGSLHGGANEKAMEMILEIGKPENAASWVQQKLEKHERIMGVGHRVYKHGDSRSDIMKELGLALAKKQSKTIYHEISQIVEDYVREEKGLLPNVDFYSASAYYLLGIPIPLYTPIFAMSRVAGWSVHIIEQLENNRLIRPRSLYKGQKPRKFIPINQR